MSDWPVPLGCGFLVLVFVGFGEGITWLIGAVVVVAVLAGGVLLVSRQVEAMPRLHGHGDTRRRAVKHEVRHEKVYRGVGGKGGHYKVWEQSNGWAGEFFPGSNWDALPREAQAAVYMAGALGNDPQQCYAKDLAAVDWLGVSRSKARRIARRYL
jgi:hypothetical protein